MGEMMKDHLKELYEGIKKVKDESSRHILMREFLHANFREAFNLVTIGQEQDDPDHDED